MSRAVLFKGIALHMRLHRGFTLVELITTMIVLGILAAFAIPKFDGRHGFSARGFSDQLLSLLQEARRTAVAQRRIVCVAANGAEISVSKSQFAASGGVCNQPLTNPNSSGNYVLPIPVGIMLAGFPDKVPLQFDPLGRLSPTTTVQLNITSAEGNFSLSIEGETGYVHY